MRYIWVIFVGLGIWAGEVVGQETVGMTPGEVAVAYYRNCGVVPLNMGAINALRTEGAREADRKLPPAALQARTGVLIAVGGHGSLLAVRVLTVQVKGDRAKVAVVLNYQKLPPNQFELALVKEDGVWKVAD